MPRFPGSGRAALLAPHALGLALGLSVMAPAAAADPVANPTSNAVTAHERGNPEPRPLTAPRAQAESRIPQTSGAAKGSVTTGSRTILESAPERRGLAPQTTTLDPTLHTDPAWRSAGPEDIVEVVLALTGPSVFDRWLAEDSFDEAAAFGPRRVDPTDPTDLVDSMAGLPAGNPPAAVTTRASRARMARHAHDLSAEQAPLHAAVHDAGGTVIAALDTVANALHVRAPRRAIEELAARADVAHVWPVPSLQPARSLEAPAARPLALQNTAPHIGADVAAALGWTGRGITIAVIDSGVDYTHRSFGGAGGYAENDPNVVEPDTFPTVKVVGGVDLAGSAYTGAGAPRPDDDPLDEGGHGTHVAGIAAGATGQAVPQGIAPDARIVAVKIFGRSGGTNLLLEGLEWVLEARLGGVVTGTPAPADVINLSLGTPWTGAALAGLGSFDRLERAGIVVVAAAGNDGDVAFVTGGPSVQPGVLSVASTVGPGEVSDLVRIHEAPNRQDLEAVQADASLARPIGAVGNVRARLAHLGRACVGDTSLAAVTGRVALIARGTCTFHEKLTRAHQEGAVAALVYDDGRGVIPMGSDLGSVPIPAFMIAHGAGLDLAARAASGVVEAELSPAFLDALPRTSVIDVVSGFTSRGPSRDGGLKPDIAAPGSGIVAPRVASTSGAVVQSGTSMASPVVAGAAAVLMQRMGDSGRIAPGGAGLGPRDVMAVLVGTAAPAWRGDATDRVRAPIARAGAGRVDLGRAVQTDLLARTGAIVSLDFGVAAFADTWHAESDVTIRNLSGQTRQFALTAAYPDAADGASGIGIRVLPERVTLAAGEQTTVRVELDGDAAAMRAYEVGDGDAAMNGDGRLHEPEHDAFLRIQELDAAGDVLSQAERQHVPLTVFARGASSIDASLGAGDGATELGSPPFVLRNDGGQSGRVVVYRVLGEDNLGGVASWLDVDWVGGRMIPPEEASPPGARIVELLVHTVAARRSPFDRYLTLELDTDLNGQVDAVAEMQDAGFQAGGGTMVWNGQLRTFVDPVGAGATQEHAIAGVDINARWLLLRLDAAQLGYAPGEPVVFEAALELENRFEGSRADGVGALGGARALVFNEGQPPFIFDPPSLVVPSGGEALLSLTAPVPPADGPAPRALLLYPDNEPANDLQIITVPPGPPAPLPSTATPGPTVEATSSPASPTEAPGTATLHPSPNTETPSPTPTETPSPRTSTATQTPTPAPTQSPPASATATSPPDSSTPTQTPVPTTTPATIPTSSPTAAPRASVTSTPVAAGRTPTVTPVQTTPSPGIATTAATASLPSPPDGSATMEAGPSATREPTSPPAATIRLFVPLALRGR